MITNFAQVVFKDQLEVLFPSKRVETPAKKGSKKEINNEFILKNMEITKKI